jgi:hypothetical protein
MALRDAPKDRVFRSWTLLPVRFALLQDPRPPGAAKRSGGLRRPRTFPSRGGSGLRELILSYIRLLLPMAGLHINPSRMDFDD